MYSEVEVMIPAGIIAGNRHLGHEKQSNFYPSPKFEKNENE